MENYCCYVAGFVGKTGGDVKFKTSFPERALAWTKANRRFGELAVCKGLTHNDLDVEEALPGYIAEHLVENVVGYDGKFTNGYLHSINKLKCA